MRLPAVLRHARTRARQRRRAAIELYAESVVALARAGSRVLVSHACGDVTPTSARSSGELCPSSGVRLGCARPVPRGHGRNSRRKLPDGRCERAR